MDHPGSWSNGKRPADDAKENAAQPAKAPRRIAPISVAPAPARPTSATNGSAAEARSSAAGSSTAPLRVDDDDSDEDDQERKAGLRALDEEGQQGVIDAYFAAKEAHDDAAELLESGPPTRALGVAHPELSDARLAVERDLLAELKAERASHGQPTSGDEFAAACADALADLAENLEERFEEACKALAAAGDDVEAAGFAVVELERKYDEAMRREGYVLDPGGEWRPEGEQPEDEEDSGEEADGAEDEDMMSGAGGASAVCRKCMRRSPTAALPALRGDASALSGLCHVCAAEAELDARAPLKVAHGRVQEKGASGFTGWTEGLRRTSDPTLLKRMYKAKRPDDVARLEAAGALALEGALEIDEVANPDDDGGAAGGADDEDDDDGSESDEEDGLAAAAALAQGGRRRPSQRRLQKALESEGDLAHLVYNRRGGRGGVREVRDEGDKPNRKHVLPECTACRAPLYECSVLYAHPELGVALCMYCHLDATSPPIEEIPSDGDVADADALPAARNQPDEICLWCSGNCPGADSTALLLCDGEGCGRAVCEGCVRLNLGAPALRAVHDSDPWRCFACDPAPLAALREACEAEKTWRQKQKDRRKASESAAAERMRDHAARAERDSADAAAKEVAAKVTAEREAAKAVEREVAARVAAARPAPAAHVSPARPPRPAVSTEASAIVLWPAYQKPAPRQRAAVASAPLLPAITVAPFLASELKPHQIEGIQFAWKGLLAEKRPEATPSNARRAEHGVVLAHSMGLGKTLSVIAFLHTALTRARNERGVDYLQYRNGKEPTSASEPASEPRPSTALVLVPRPVATQWYSEWKRWVTKHDPHPPQCYQWNGGSHLAMFQTMRLWRATGGVLIMSHDAFWRLLQAPKAKSATAAAAAASAAAAAFDHNFVSENQHDMAEVEKLLLDPGPDVVVMDEAHRIKNDLSTLSKALQRIKTRRRILLTGTPLQNNLVEYFHMVDFVKPGYLGDVAVFKLLFVEHINRGAVNYNDADDRKRKKAMDMRVHTLTRKLDMLVQRRSVEILARTLPPRYDVVLHVRFSEVQRNLYNEMLLRTERGNKRSIFLLAHVMRRIFDHPAMLLLFERNYRGKVSKSARAPAFADGTDEPVAEGASADMLPPRWWEETWPTTQLTAAQTVSAELSGKVALTLEILKQAVENDEKVLLFTQSLESLSVLEEVLKLAPSPRERGGVGWQRGLDYLRFDGSVDPDERDTMISHFASPALKLRLFLISTKAGGQGLNLAAASRVIVFDASWNPATDTQAVYRAYRYGQTRPVFVYRFIAEGFEQCLYRQQIVKLQLAGRVLDEQSHEAQFSHSELKDLWKEIPLPLPVPPSAHAGAIAALPTASWVGSLTNGDAGHWLMRIEDHDKGLEGVDGSLDATEMEDAENDLRKDENELARESAVCDVCNKTHSNYKWNVFQLRCTNPSCGGAMTLLCPAAPIVARQPNPGHLHFIMHGEGHQNTTTFRSALPDDGAYHVQWREFKADSMNNEDDWQNPKKLVKRSSFVSKKSLDVNKQYQVRVRARLGPCKCGNGENNSSSTEWDYLLCGSEDNPAGCQWTPWSQPSAPATPYQVYTEPPPAPPPPAAPAPARAVPPVPVARASSGDPRQGDPRNQLDPSALAAAAVAASGSASAARAGPPAPPPAVPVSAPVRVPVAAPVAAPAPAPVAPPVAMPVPVARAASGDPRDQQLDPSLLASAAASAAACGWAVPMSVPMAVPMSMPMGLDPSAFAAAAAAAAANGSAAAIAAATAAAVANGSAAAMAAAVVAGPPPPHVTAGPPAPAVAGPPAPQMNWKPPGLL